MTKYYYVVEVHSFNPLSRRLPPRRRVHSVHHTSQRAKSEATKVLYRITSSLSGPDFGTGYESVQEIDPDEDELYSGYEVRCHDRSVIAVKMRRTGGELTVASSPHLAPIPEELPSNPAEICIDSDSDSVAAVALSDDSASEDGDEYESDDIWSDSGSENELKTPDLDDSDSGSWTSGPSTIASVAKVVVRGAVVVNNLSRSPTVQGEKAAPGHKRAAISICSISKGQIVSTKVVGDVDCV